MGVLFGSSPTPRSFPRGRSGMRSPAGSGRSCSTRTPVYDTRTDESDTTSHTQPRPLLLLYSTEPTLPTVPSPTLLSKTETRRSGGLDRGCSDPYPHRTLLSELHPPSNTIPVWTPVDLTKKGRGQREVMSQNDRVSSVLRPFPPSVTEGG